jgi:hypothetical protein
LMELQKNIFNLNFIVSYTNNDSKYNNSNNK